MDHDIIAIAFVSILFGAWLAVGVIQGGPYNNLYGNDR